jgi:hypothetical protein
MINWSTVAWRRSTRCESNSCVEVGLLSTEVAMRDSKDANGAVLLFTAAEWTAFLEGARRGEFELTPSRK